MTEDQRALPELVGEIYEAALDPERWTSFIARLSEIYRGGALLFSQDFDTADASIFAVDGFSTSALQSYLDYFRTKNVWMPSMQRASPGSIVLSSEMIPRPVFERTEFFCDWLKPHDLDFGIGGIAENDHTKHTAISVLRAPAEGDYTRSERATFQLLAQHVRRALQIRRALAIREIERDVALAGLARAGTALLLVDEAGRILLANDRAQALLKVADGLADLHGKITANREQTTDRLRRHIASAVQIARGDGVRLDAALMLPRRNGPPLTAIVSPLPRPLDSLGIGTPAALMLVRDPAAPAGSLEILRQLFRLTAREAELALALAEGLSQGEFAERQGISPHTAHAHLKSLMRKTACRRQPELVSLVLRSVAGFTLSQE